MNTPIDYRGTWKTRRYAWKKRLTDCRNLSNGSRLLASVLCDSYANHKTACCFPSNETLARDLNVNLRTAQRYLKELLEGRWVRKVRLEKRRRGLQLVFPTGCEYDSPVGARAAYLSRDHDNRVAPHIEPKNNHGNGLAKGSFASPFSYVLVRSDEVSPLAAWRTWIASNTTLDPEVILETVSEKGGYRLPCRFPCNEPGDAEAYLGYFEAERARRSCEKRHG